MRNASHTHHQAEGEPGASDRLSLIVAVAKNGIIGRSGQLPWRLSADLIRFKRLTMGHHLVMGRRTFESIGRLLPGRTTVVVTRQSTYEAPGALVANDLRQALQLAADDDEVFITGGAELYRQALPLVNRIYQTQVHADVEGDVCFPELDESAWHVVSLSHHAIDEKNEFETTFRELIRR